MKKIYRTAVVGLTGIGDRRAPVESDGLRRPMGRSHVSAYVTHPRTELVAVCDLRREALEEFRALNRNLIANSFFVALPNITICLDHPSDCGSCRSV